MKILKLGNPVVYKGTCHLCKCEFECEFKEMYDLYPIASVAGGTAHCPSCGVLTKVTGLKISDQN